MFRFNALRVVILILALFCASSVLVFAEPDTEPALKPQVPPKPQVPAKPQAPAPQAAKPEDKRPKGKLFVQSDPPNAAVRLLNLPQKFKQGIELPEGSYQLDIKVEGYEVKVARIDMVAGKDATVVVKLEKTGGPSTKDNEAAKPAEQKVTDQTPVPGADDKVLKRDVPVSKSKEADAFKEKTKKGWLAVRADPADASVNLLGVKRKYERGMELEQGQYDVEVKRDGYMTHTQTVDIIGGMNATLDLTLKKAVSPTQAGSVDRAKAAEADMLLRKALAAQKDNDLALAEEAADNALKVSPLLAKAYVVRGGVFLARKDNARAAEDLSRALQLNAEDAAAYVLRAKAYLNQNDMDSACYDLWNACAFGQCKEIGEAKAKGDCR